MLLPLLLQLADAAFQPAPTPDEQEIITAQVDAVRRLSVPVGVDNQPPIGFLIDTGAERTVLGSVIAAGLPGPRRAATLVHVAGRSNVQVVEVERLSLGRSVYRGIEAPILPRVTMGVDGILGTDALQDQRVLFDFKGGRVTLIQHGEQPALGDVIVVRGRRKSGRLILTSASIDGVDVDVVLDTGAAQTIANPALADRLRRRGGTAGVLTSITGDTIALRLLAVKRLTIGDLLFQDFRIGVTDSPAFDALDLGDRPAILLGMDAIGRFDRVLVDFPRRSVAFALAPGTQRVQR